MKKIFIAISILFICVNTATCADIKNVATDFTLNDLVNQKFSLKDFNNKIILIDFWATWCGPCKQSLPWLNNLQKNYDKEKFVVIAITVDKDLNKVNKFVEETKIKDLLILHDKYGKIAKKYRLKSFPSSFLIGLSGKIIATYNGFNDKHKKDIELKIKKLLHL
jgi:cytochrome c biogenesis protein CcmG, thiol:disulfide interchange protein DsbE